MDSVIFIGNFAGGSFGRPGDPFRTFPYYALQSDLDSEFRSREVTQLVAFPSKREAQDRLVSLTQNAVATSATAEVARTTRLAKHALGRTIRAAIEQHTGRPVRTLRVIHIPQRPETLSEEYMAVVHEYPAEGVVVAETRYGISIGSSGLSVKVVERPTE